MTQTARDSSQPLTLHFSNAVRVAGETLEGDIDFNLALAQEDGIERVRVKLRGSIQAKFVQSNGQSATTYKESISLVRSDAILWTQGSAFPPPGSHVLRLPFRFELPLTLPPSFHYKSSYPSRSGIITYWVEIVGERSGIFKTNRRIRSVFPVVPVADQGGLNARTALTQGWSGEWKCITLEDKIRQGLWGSYANVKAEVVLPALASFPISVFIPFRLHVTTHTKPMKRSETPVDNAKKPLFPTPPSHPSQIELRLDRHVRIQARGRKRKVEDDVTLLGGMGRSHSAPGWGSAVRVRQDEMEWIPAFGEKDEKGKGVWKRVVVFESSMAFTCPPSFNTRILSNQYCMHLYVPFLGIGNSLKANVPISITSGLSPRPPPTGPSSAPALDEPLGPPPAVDLPPAYWNGDDHDWDADEKN